MSDYKQGSISPADSDFRGGGGPEEEEAVMPVRVRPSVRAGSVANHIGSASGWRGGGGWALFNHRIDSDTYSGNRDHRTNYSVRLRDCKYRSAVSHETPKPDRDRQRAGI